MANVLNKDPFTYEEDRRNFIQDLQRFHASRGTPFDRIPEISGRQIDLYRLYRRVIDLGGWQKVNNDLLWEDIQEEFKIPIACTNGSQALKYIYFRYLNIYEKVHFLGVDPDQSTDEQDEGPARKKVCLPVESVPLTYNYNQHKITDAQRAASRLSTDLVRFSDYEKLEMSLRSGLPNEVDFAFNICLLLSSEGRHVLKLNQTRHLIPLLLANIGIFEQDCSTMEDIMLQSWKMGDSKRDFLRFWHNTVKDEDIKEFILTKSGVYKEEERLGSEVLHLGREVGMRDAEGQRIIQLATLIRNLSFEEFNQQPLASNRLIFRFMMLCIYSDYGCLRQLALDAFGNLAAQMVLEPVKSLTTRLTMNLIRKSLFEEDKFVIVRGLEILSRLCQLEKNELVLNECVEEETYERIVQLLTVHDIQLIVHTLEALYQLSELGDTTTTMIANVRHAVDLLVNLITVEAQSYGPDSLVGIKVVEYVPPPDLSAPAAPAGSMPPPSRTVIQSVAPGQAASFMVPPPPQAPTADQARVDVETTASNWLQATFEAKKGTIIIQAELFAEYQQFCRKFGVADIITAADFINIVKAAVPHTSVAEADRGGGEKEGIIRGICRRSAPRPFAILAGSDRVYKPSACSVPASSLRPFYHDPSGTPPPIYTPTLRQRLMEPPRMVLQPPLVHPAGATGAGASRPPTPSRQQTPGQKQPPGPGKKRTLPVPPPPAQPSGPGPGPASPGPALPLAPPASVSQRPMLKQTLGYTRITALQQQAQATGGHQSSLGGMRPAAGDGGMQISSATSIGFKPSAQSMSIPVSVPLVVSAPLFSVPAGPLSSASSSSSCTASPGQQFPLIHQALQGDGVVSSPKVSAIVSAAGDQGNESNLIKSLLAKKVCQNMVRHGGTSPPPQAESSEDSSANTSMEEGQPEQEQHQSDQPLVQVQGVQTLPVQLDQHPHFLQPQVPTAATVALQPGQQSVLPSQLHLPQGLAAAIPQQPQQGQQLSVQQVVVQQHLNSQALLAHQQQNTQAMILQQQLAQQQAVQTQLIQQPRLQIQQQQTSLHSHLQMQQLVQQMPTSGLALQPGQQIAHGYSQQAVHSGQAVQHQQVAQSVTQPQASHTSQQVVQTSQQHVTQGVAQLPVSHTSQQVFHSGQSTQQHLVQITQPIQQQQLVQSTQQQQHAAPAVNQTHIHMSQQVFQMGQSLQQQVMHTGSQPHGAHQAQQVVQASQSVQTSAVNQPHLIQSQSQQQVLHQTCQLVQPQVTVNQPQMIHSQTQQQMTVNQSQMIHPQVQQQVTVNQPQMIHTQVQQQVVGAQHIQTQAQQIQQVLTLPQGQVFVHRPQHQQGQQIHIQPRVSASVQTATSLQIQPHQQIVLQSGQMHLRPQQQIILQQHPQHVVIQGQPHLLQTSQQLTFQPSQQIHIQAQGQLQLPGQGQHLRIQSAPGQQQMVIQLPMYQLSQGQMAAVCGTSLASSLVQTSACATSVMPFRTVIASTHPAVTITPAEACAAAHQQVREGSDSLESVGVGRPNSALYSALSAPSQLEETASQTVAQQTLRDTAQGGQPTVPAAPALQTVYCQGLPSRVIQTAVSFPPSISFPQPPAASFPPSSLQRMPTTSVLTQASGTHLAHAAHLAPVAESQQTPLQQQQHVVIASNNGHFLNGKMPVNKECNGQDVNGLAESLDIDMIPSPTADHLLNGMASEGGLNKMKDCARNKEAFIEKVCKVNGVVWHQHANGSIDSVRMQVDDQRVLESRELMRISSVESDMCQVNGLSGGVEALRERPSPAATPSAPQRNREQTLVQQASLEELSLDSTDSKSFVNGRVITGDAGVGHSRPLFSPDSSRDSDLSCDSFASSAADSVSSDKHSTVSYFARLPSSSSSAAPSPCPSTSSTATSTCTFPDIPLVLAGTIPMSEAIDKKNKKKAAAAKAKAERPPPKSSKKKKGTEGSSSMGVQATLSAEYMCEWLGCRRCFSTARLVFIHVTKVHVPPAPESVCQWQGCEPLRRKRWSLVTHLQDQHCSEAAQRAGLQRRAQQGHTPSQPSASPQQAPALVYPPDAAMQAIKRFQIKKPYPELSEVREGPVTKHIRLTAALILRNLARYSPHGRSLIKHWERQLSYVTMGAVESSTALAHCLWEIMHDT